MSARVKIRVRTTPRFFEALESRVLLDGYFDWGSLSDDLTPVMPVDTSPVDTSPVDTTPVAPSDNSGSDNTFVDDTYSSVVLPVASPPAQPLLTLQNGVGSAVLLAWYQPMDSDGFGIFRRGPTGGWKHVATVAWNVGSYTDFQTLAGTRYSYYVMAFNSDGSTNSDAAWIDTPGVHLRVTAQMGTVTAGAVFGITVALQDAGNHTETSVHSTLTVAVASGPAGASLAGTTSVQADHGVAVFSGLSLTKAGSYRLLLSDGTSTTLTQAFTVKADAAAAHLALLQPPVAGTLGQALTLKLAVNDAFGNLVTTDASRVTLALVSGPADGGLGGTLTANVRKGTATFGPLMFTRAGTYTLTATDLGLADPVPLQFTLGVAPAITTIAMPAVAGGGYVFGAPITFSAVLKSSARLPFSGEALLVGADGTVLATAGLSPSGQARFAWQAEPGVYRVTIQYAGDADHAAATSRAFTIKSLLAPAMVTLQASPSLTTFGQPVTLRAAVHSDLPTMPGGTVTFFDGPLNLGTVPLENTGAALVLANPGVGRHAYRAVYSGDAHFKTARAAVAPVIIQRAATSVTLAGSEAPLALPAGAPLALAATATLTIQVTPQTALFPTGTVAIFEGGRRLATVTLRAGVALWVPSLKGGTHLLTARYLGDGNNLPSVSGTLRLNLV